MDEQREEREQMLRDILVEKYGTFAGNDVYDFLDRFAVQVLRAKLNILRPAHMEDLMKALQQIRQEENNLVPPASSGTTISSS